MSDAFEAAEALEFLDANAVLRYLLADHEQHFVLAKSRIESERSFRISVVTLAETGYVLTRLAGVPRSDAVDAMTDLLSRENIEIHEIRTGLAIEALELCRDSGRVNFADALLWATARAAAPSRVWSFDRRFPGDGIEIQQP